MLHPTNWPAMAISTALLPWLATETDRWRVLSVHRHACNLISPSGQIVALVSPSHGYGPFHIVVPDVTLAAIGLGDDVQLDRGQFIFSRGQLDLSVAIHWSPRWPEQGHASLDQLSPWLCAISASVASPLWPTPGQPLSPLQQRAAPAIAELMQGQANGNLVLIAASASRLAGLGPGLTPAGDDLLVGWLAGLYWRGADWQGAGKAGAATIQSIGAFVAATTTPRTTRLSAAWLQHAALGEFGAPWHDWVAALHGGERSQVMAAGQAILRRGATSGHDAMLGFLLACRMGQPPAPSSQSC